MGNTSSTPDQFERDQLDQRYRDDRRRFERLDEDSATFGLPLQTDRVRTRENLLKMYGELAEVNLEQCMAEINAGRCHPEDQRLREAARDGDVDMVRTMLEKQRGDPTAPFDLAFPLQYAVRGDHVECVRLLLPVSGRRATTCDELDVHMARAALHAQYEMLELLAEWFPRRNVLRGQQAPIILSAGPSRAMAVAARENDAEACRVLLSIWRPGSTDDHRWRWALDQAVETAATGILRALLERLPMDQHGAFLCYIHQAFLSNNYETFRTCLDIYQARYGALTSLLDDYLLRSIRDEHLNILRYLRDFGNMTLDAVGTAVRYCVAENCAEALRLLGTKYDLLAHLSNWAVVYAWARQPEIYAVLYPNSCMSG